MNRRKRSLSARRGFGLVIALGPALFGLAGGLGAGPAQAEGLADWQGKWAGDRRIRPPHRGVSRVDATLKVCKRADRISAELW